MMRILKVMMMWGLALSLTAISANCFARFVSVDPVAANSNTGENFNRYWYANDNPYKYIDPDGRNPKGCGDGTCNGIMISGPLKYRQGVHGRIEQARAASPELSRRIETLENSAYAHRIVDSAKNPELQGAPANVNLTSSSESETNGVGTGTTTFYDPDQRMTPPGSEMGSPEGVLAHELLGHAYDKDQGENDRSTNPGTGNNRAEERANKVELILVKSTREKDE